MCLFPLPNLNHDSLAYKKGVTEFDCGACPECLRKRSNQWALRSVFESKDHDFSCMITLTYDKFKYNAHGSIIGEEDVNPDLKVNKRHIQLFIKRLRKHFNNQSIKYIACAEYGSRTHRAHYHCILFGVNFADKHYYKRSKRGNPIYMSSTLTNLWSHGICTIDSVDVRSNIARYCTKYCAKTRSDETFMLCSHGIGLNQMFKHFNGISYFIQGREYPIPRFVWQKYIYNKYKGVCSDLDYRYLNKTSENIIDSWYVNDLGEKIPILGEFSYNRKCRENYRFFRDNDPVYIKYLNYWNCKGKQFDSHRLSILSRIYLLSDRKFHNFKVKALFVYSLRDRFKVPFIAPGSNCRSRYNRYIYEKMVPIGEMCSFARASRPNRANDTNSDLSEAQSQIFYEKFKEFYENPLTFFINSV